MSKVRTRFAPSPTGQVHIGNIRAAIYNWLYARHTGGQFLLRIEDTDIERSTPQAVQTVIESMAWMGLNCDEPPVYQSTQLARHLAAAETLVSKGLAYREDKGGTGRGECIVFRMPGNDITFQDEIKGPLTKAAKDMADFVIVRSNGTPVFHLANVVDDINMDITHVIRGDDHVENTFRHIALFEALGAQTPRYAHLPMIVNQHGKPYSKRDGDAYVGDFRTKGYLGEALFNYLVLLGWSSGDDREIFTREELSARFDFDRVQSSPAQMDIKKLQWMNGEYIRALPAERLEAECRDALRARDLWNDHIGMDYYRQVLSLMRERLKFFSDIADIGGFFFTEDFPFDEKAVAKRLHREGARQHLRAMREVFSHVAPFTAETTDKALHHFAESHAVAAGDLVHPVRVAISGLAGGPGLFQMLEVLGKERCLARMDRALARLGD